VQWSFFRASRAECPKLRHESFSHESHAQGTFAAPYADPRHTLILAEAAIAERLRRMNGITLHPTLFNSPLIYHDPHLGLGVGAGESF
jgi:hypothetical protein